MIIKAKNYIQKKKRMIYMFYDVSEYFPSGNYVFSKNLKYICRKDQKIIDKAEFLFGEKNKNKLHNVFIAIIKLFFFSGNLQINTENTSMEFSGSIYLPGTTHGEKNEAKIFDHENNKVMSILSSEHNFIQKKETYNRFGRFFPMPFIEYENENKLVIIENLIEFISEKNWIDNNTDSFTTDLFFRYINYFQDCNQNNEYTMITPKALFLMLPDSKLKFYLHKRISKELMNTEFAKVKLHGDLWSANILKEKDSESKFYYIDWEHTTEFILFYDIFWFIQNQVIYHDNHIFIENYINGQYDDFFIQIFQIFDMDQYKTEYKIDYIIIFMLNVFVTRLANADEKTIEVVTNNFIKLLERYM